MPSSTLTVDTIKASIKAFHEKHGEWPNTSTTDQSGAPVLSWQGLDEALELGREGLPGGSSLSALREELSKDV